MAKQSHGGLDAEEGLAGEGEDGEDGDGVWVEMEKLNLVMLQNGEEERRGGSYQAGGNGVVENGENGENGGVQLLAMH